MDLFMHGIHQNLIETVRSKVEIVVFLEALGSAFDPRLHEAAVQRAEPGVTPGEVCEELRRLEIR